MRLLPGAENGTPREQPRPSNVPLGLPSQALWKAALASSASSPCWLWKSKPWPWHQTFLTKSPFSLLSNGCQAWIPQGETYKGPGTITPAGGASPCRTPPAPFPKGSGATRGVRALARRPTRHVPGGLFTPRLCAWLPCQVVSSGRKGETGRRCTHPTSCLALAQLRGPGSATGPAKGKLASVLETVAGSESRSAHLGGAPPVSPAAHRSRLAQGPC